MVGVPQVLKNILLTMIAPLTWGTTYFVTTEFLPPDRPFLSGALRVLPVGLLMLLLFRRLPQGMWWRRAAVVGMFNIGLAFAGIFVAAYRLPGGVAATNNAVQPFLVAFIGWPLLGLVPKRYTLLAATLGLLGVGLLVLGPSSRLDGLGVAAGLGGVLASACGIVLLRRWGRPEVSLLVLTAWQLVAGGLFLTLLAAVEVGYKGGLPTFSPTNLGGYLYMAVISTGLAYALWFRGIERLPPASVAIIGLVNPVVAFALGYFFKGQTVSLVQGLGIALILSSIIIEQGGNLRQPAPSNAAAVPPLTEAVVAASKAGR